MTFPILTIPPATNDLFQFNKEIRLDEDCTSKIDSKSAIATKERFENTVKETFVELLKQQPENNQASPRFNTQVNNLKANCEKYNKSVKSAQSLWDWLLRRPSGCISKDTLKGIDMLQKGQLKSISDLNFTFDKTHIDITNNLVRKTVIGIFKEKESISQEKSLVGNEWSPTTEEVFKRLSEFDSAQSTSGSTARIYGALNNLLRPERINKKFRSIAEPLTRKLTIESKIESKLNSLTPELSDSIRKQAKVSKCSISGLTDLDLRFLEVTSEDLSTIKTIANLESISLGGNITDAHFKELGRFTHLTKLGCTSEVPMKGITDEGLKSLGLFSQLSAITLPGLKSLGQISQLSAVTLSGCPNITDDGLASLGQISQLSAVTLSGCPNITDRGLENLWRKLGRQGPKKSGAFLNITNSPQIKILLRTSYGSSDIATELSKLSSPVYQTFRKQMGLSDEQNSKDIQKELEAGLQGAKALDLSGLAVSSEELAAIRKIIGDNTVLESILLSTDISEAHCEELAKFPCLKKFKYTNGPSNAGKTATGLTDKGLVSLGTSTSLESLSLSNCPNITVDGLNRTIDDLIANCNACSSANSVSSLELDNCGDGNLSDLHAKRTNQLNLKNCLKLPTNMRGKLTHLSLDKLPPGQIEKLTDAVEPGLHIQIDDLSNHNAENLKKIQCLRFSKEISELNKIPEEIRTNILIQAEIYNNLEPYQIIQELLDPERGLETLDLSSSTVSIADLAAIREISNLTSISLGSDITEAHFKELAKFPSLDTLNCSGIEPMINITDGTIRLLEESESLRDLTLSNCPNISDQIFQDIKHIKGLESLTLSNCPSITDSGLAFHSSAYEMTGLTSHEPLKSLTLSNCPEITNRGLENLEYADSLESLTLSECPNITEEGLKRLTNSTTLKSIKISNCQQVSDAILSLSPPSDIFEKSLNSLPENLKESLLAQANISQLLSAEEIRTQLKGFTTGLKTLDLSAFSVSLEELAVIRNITNLRSISLGSGTTDAHLAEIAKFNYLTEFKYIGERSSMDEDPPSITNKGLEHLGDSLSLESLSLSNCRGITVDGINRAIDDLVTNCPGCKIREAIKSLELDNCCGDGDLSKLNATQVAQLDLRHFTMLPEHIGGKLEHLILDRVSSDQIDQLNQNKEKRTKEDPENFILIEIRDLSTLSRADGLKIRSLIMTPRSLEKTIYRLDKLPVSIPPESLYFDEHKKLTSKLSKAVRIKLIELLTGNDKDTEIPSLNNDSDIKFASDLASLNAMLSNLNKLLGQSKPKEAAKKPLVEIPAAETTPNFTSLEDIDLGTLQVSPEEITAIARLTNVRSLSLGGNITDAHLREIAKIFNLQKFNYTGKTVGTETYGGSITDKGLEYLSNLGKVQSMKERLQDIEGLESIANSIKLQSVTLSGCPNITDAGLLGLGSISSLDSVEVSDCSRVTLRNLPDIRNASASHVMEQLDQLSESVKLALLSKAGISNEAAPAEVQKKLKGFITGLKALDLSAFAVSPEELAVIRNITNLRSISLGSGTTDAHLAEIAKFNYLTEFKYIGERSTSKTSAGITDEGLGHLGRSESLESLSLSNSPNITVEGLNNMVTSLTNKITEGYDERYEGRIKGVMGSLELDSCCQGGNLSNLDAEKIVRLKLTRCAQLPEKMGGKLKHLILDKLSPDKIDQLKANIEGWSKADERDTDLTNLYIQIDDLTTLSDEDRKKIGTISNIEIEDEVAADKSRRSTWG
ncbi:hypothetical protein SCG7086_AG_00060 [Chlamydiales bacterium SCGC AG-110-P3]|nr:hypothetical protein SCG7086_AG_00060 [Chlamydiales bacterium SCGC AG-110-P3]